MLDQIVLFSQTVSVALITTWLLIGVWDNILYPENNRVFTGQVMAMTRMKNDYPQEFARVSGRAIVSPNIQKTAFRLVVFAQLIAVLLLCFGVAQLTMALLGLAKPDAAKAAALVGTLFFTAIWAGFLVVGNYFCYWYCHETGQNTHFQMTLWGIANMVFLATT